MVKVNGTMYISLQLIMKVFSRKITLGSPHNSNFTLGLLWISHHHLIATFRSSNFFVEIRILLLDQMHFKRRDNYQLNITQIYLHKIRRGKERREILAIEWSWYWHAPYSITLLFRALYHFKLLNILIFKVKEN